MSPDTPSSNEVLETKLDNLTKIATTNFERINGSIAKAIADIDELKKFRNQHEGEIRGIKWVGGVIATALGLLIAFLKVDR